VNSFAKIFRRKKFHCSVLGARCSLSALLVPKSTPPPPTFTEFSIRFSHTLFHPHYLHVQVQVGVVCAPLISCVEELLQNIFRECLAQLSAPVSLRPLSTTIFRPTTPTPRPFSTPSTSFPKLAYFLLRAQRASLENCWPGSWQLDGAGVRGQRSRGGGLRGLRSVKVCRCVFSHE